MATGRVNRVLILRHDTPNIDSVSSADIAPESGQLWVSR